MNLSFEWRSYLLRLGLAFRSALVSLCSRAREPFRALLTKESFFPRFKLARLKTGILSSANVLDTDIISSINALVKYFWNFFDKIFLEVLKMRFSELLTDLRKEYNLSQMQLAAIVD